MKDLRIAIIGGGIGGLACAAALQSRGFAPTIFEQSKALGEIGAGLTMAPNAMRVLRDLGLSALVDQADIPTFSRIRAGVSGEVLTETEMGEVIEGRYGAPYGFLHRADVLNGLAQIVTSHEKTRLCLNHELVDVEQNKDSVSLTFSNGEQAEFDLVIGCDGIRSKVRSFLFGDVPALFTGNIAWRGLVPMELLPSDMEYPPSGVLAGPRRHFVHYNLRGGALMNYVAIAEKDDWQVESWTEPSSPEEILEEFGDWHPSVIGMINATPKDLCYKWALFDRDPLSTWHKGRVTLLGDAAHPMLPFLGQGAAMALEDAVVFARALDAHADLEEALQLYERSRQERTSWAQLESREAGKRFHDNTLGSETFKNDRAMQMERLFSYDATAVELEE